MNLKYFTNISDGVFELILHGVVGEEINGDEIANEIKFLNDNGAKVIKERINSIGGGIFNGMSIVSANLESKAEIHTFNAGIAASMASVILASGTPGKRKGFDFSTSVIHNPLGNGVSLNDMPEGKEKEDMKIFKDSLIDLYVNNTKLTKKEASELMDGETLLNSKRQKEIGLIDEIVKSKMKPAITENMALSEIMNVCDEIKEKSNLREEKIDNDPGDQNNSLKPNIIKMKDVTNRLKLPEGASEINLIQAIDKIESRAVKAEGEVTSLKADIESKDGEITALKSEVAEYEAKAVKDAVKAAISSGKYQSENEDELTNLCKEIGVENFNKMVDFQKIPHVDVVNNITTKEPDASVKDDKLAKEFFELSKNETELAKFKAANPAKYEKMAEAFQNSDY